MNKVIEFQAIRDEKENKDFVESCISFVTLEAFMDIANEINRTMQTMNGYQVNTKQWFDKATKGRQYYELKYAVETIRIQGENLINYSRFLKAHIPQYQLTYEENEKYEDLVKSSSKYYMSKTTPIVDKYLATLMAELDEEKAIEERSAKHDRKRKDADPVRSPEGSIT